MVSHGLDSPISNLQLIFYPTWIFQHGLLTPYSAQCGERITTVDALIPKQTNKHDASGVGAVTLHKTIINKPYHQKSRPSLCC